MGSRKNPASEVGDRAGGEEEGDGLDEYTLPAIVAFAITYNMDASAFQVWRNGRGSQANKM